MGLKKDFVWGIITVAYQIEGGYNQDKTNIEGVIDYENHINID